MVNLLKDMKEVRPQFVYCNDDTYQDNFERWHLAQCIERELHDLVPITIEMSWETFTYWWGHKRS
tara:strand:+ start:755 stop:949 length:195 start_codon:yes stop_codon:yes gene_type:complete